MKPLYFVILLFLLVVNQSFSITSEKIFNLAIPTSDHSEEIVTNSTASKNTKDENLILEVPPISDPTAFITTWKTTEENESIILRLSSVSGISTINIDWGDGTTSFSNYQPSHTYASPGIYTVTASGTFNKLAFGSSATNSLKIISVDQWGNAQWLSLEGAFRGCSNLQILATDAPDLNLVTSTRLMFRNATSFNQDISAWDVSKVTDMSEMFNGATSFNQDISAWDVSSVNDMNLMFYSATSFNQNLNTWDVGSVTNMENMFRNAPSFNQSIGSWNVGNVINMSVMFGFATSFNQDISGWNVGNTTEMDAMFQGATSFNQNIGDWDVSKVTTMIGMFYSATSFNQNIGTWNVGNVTTMRDMFRAATAFDQNLGFWDVSKVADMFGMFSFGAKLSNANYDALLTGWSSRNLMNNVVLSTGDSKYCLGAEARQKIIITYNWSISDKGKDCSDAFISKWNTTIPNESITVPLSAESATSIDINWGDGTVEYGLGNNPSHTYVTAGTYTVSASGTYERINFNNSGSKLNIISIENWGTTNWITMNGAFYGCSNLMGYATDKPDLSGVTDISNMFRDATSFNQNIGTWNVSNVTNMNGMFTGTELSSTNYDELLKGWASQTLQPNVVFDGGNSKYCLAETARLHLISNYNWTLNDLGSDCSDAFITKWKTTSTNESITVPLSALSGTNINIDWGDGTIETGLGNNPTHSYAIAGNYTITVGGSFDRFYFSSASSQVKIISIDQWGATKWSTMNYAFSGCANLVINATDKPDLSGVTSMIGMFREANSFNQDISTWDVSNVTDMSYMFYRATSFNQAIGTWNVSSVANMERMFLEASSFNQDLSDWDVSNVNTMAVMFQNASSFNQNLGTWNVSIVTNMLGMFFRTPISVANYDALLIGWSTLTLQNNVGFNVNDLRYCEGENARQHIIDTYGWTFYEDRKIQTALSALSLNSGTLFDFDPAILNYTVSLQGCVESIIVSATATDGNHVTVSGTGSTLLNSIFPSTQDLVITVSASGGCETVYTITVTRGSLETCNYRDDNCNGLVDDGIGICENNEFITTWKTTVSDETITFPLSAVSGTSMDIDWGDGTVQTGLGNNPTHTYAAAGTYTVSVGGIFDRVWFNNSGSKLNIISIDQWGITPWRAMDGAFYGCSNLQGLATDAPDLSNVTTLFTMFRGAASFNQDISTWDVSSVTTIQGMFNGATSFNQDLKGWDVGNVITMVATFLGATSFNQDLSSWDVSKVSNMNSMFSGIKLSSANYDALLIGWAPKMITVSNRGFSGGLSTYCTGLDARNAIIAKGWTVTDGGTNGAEVNLQGNGMDIEAGASTPSLSDDTDFGNVVLNAPTVKTYTIQNTGSTTLVVSSIMRSGANTADFVVGDITLPAVIAAGANTTFTITLTQTTEGIKTATVTINNDDCDEGVYTFAVKGSSCTTPIISSVSPSSGSSGANITISGSDFGGESAPTVTIGGVSMVVVSATETSITATLPAGICGGSIVVKNSCDVISNSKLYSYAAPVIASVSPSNDTSGTNITISGSNFGGASAPTVTIGGVSMVVVSSTATSIVATLPSGICGGDIVAKNSCDVTSNNFPYILPAAGITNNTNETVLTCDLTSISITATGGYSYSWSDGVSEVGVVADFSIKSSGTYTVTVTSGNGCIDTESIIVTEDKTAPTAGITNNTGETILTNTLTSISLTATGGTSYSWSDGVSEVSTVADLLITTPGIYTVTVFGTNGCSDDAPIVITQNLSTVLDVTGVVTDVLCFNEKNGTIDITVFGGIAPYSFKWSNKKTTEDISGLKADNYTVRVKDAVGDEKTVSFTISNPPLLTISSTQTNLNSCKPDVKGSITPIASGGTGSYSYTINTGAVLTNGIFTDLETGFYTITVTDENNCSQSKSITILETLGITFQTEKSDVTSCASNGSIRINATGGSSPYAYSIDGGATWQSDNSFSNLSQGNYSLQVKDANECETATSTVLITDNGSDAYENNNSLGAAKTISFESTYQARLGNQGDTDWFKYTSPKSPKSEGTYYLIFDPQADGQMAELYKATGSLITPLETGSVEGSSGTYGSYYLSARESYYIKVYGATSLLCYNIRLSSSLDSAFRIIETQSEEIQTSSLEVEMKEEYDVVAYPNPSNGLFRLDLPGFENGDVKLRIVDGMGRLIFNEIGFVVNGKMLEEADLTNVAKGVYYVQVIQGGKAKTIRVILK